MGSGRWEEWVVGGRVGRKDERQGCGRTGAKERWLKVVAAHLKKLW